MRKGGPLLLVPGLVIPAHRVAVGDGLAVGHHRVRDGPLDPSARRRKAPRSRSAVPNTSADRPSDLPCLGRVSLFTLLAGGSMAHYTPRPPILRPRQELDGDARVRKDYHYRMTASPARLPAINTGARLNPLRQCDRVAVHPQDLRRGCLGHDVHIQRFFESIRVVYIGPRGGLSALGSAHASEPRLHRRSGLAP